MRRKQKIGSWRSRPRWQRTCRSYLAMIMDKALPRGKKLVGMRQHWRNAKRLRLRYINGYVKREVDYRSGAFGRRLSNGRKAA